MKKIILIILMLGISANTYAWNRVYNGYKLPMFTDNGNGTFSSTPDMEKMKDYTKGSVDKFLPPEYQAVFNSAGLDFGCPAGYSPTMRMTYVGSGPDTEYWPGQIMRVYSNWYFMSYPNPPETYPPMVGSYIMNKGCAEGYDETINDSDGDGIKDVNDPEPLNSAVWTEITCIDEQIGCHAGIYSTQALSGTGSVKIIESVYDENGKMVWAKIEFTNESTCSDGPVGEICVQGTQTMIIGDENIIDKLSIEGKGTTVTAPIEFETFDEFKSYTAKNLDGSIGTELVDKVVQTPGGYKHYGDWTNDPGAVAATEALDYSGQYQAMNQNLIGVGQRSEKQISQLDRIANSLKSIDSGITKQGSEIKNALAGIGTGDDGTGTGDDGVPWGEGDIDNFVDPTDTDGATQGINLADVQKPDTDEINDNFIIPEEYQTKDQTWKDDMRALVANNPVSNIVNGIQIKGANSSSSFSATVLGTEIIFDGSPYESVLTVFGYALCSAATLLGIVALLRRN